MDPLVNYADPDTEPEPAVPQAVLRRLMGLFTVPQLQALVNHSEDVIGVPGRQGEITVTVKNGKIHDIGHRASDLV